MNKVKLYHNIDTLVEDTQKPNYAALSYNLKPAKQTTRPSTAHKFERKTGFGDIQVHDPVGIVGILEEVRSANYSSKLE